MKNKREERRGASRIMTKVATLILALFSVVGSVSAQSAKVRLCPQNPTPNDSVVIEVSGIWGSSCIPCCPQASIVGRQITVNALNPVRPGQFCLQVLTPYSLRIGLDRVPRGSYQVVIRLNNLFGRPPEEMGRTSFTVAADDVCDPGLPMLGQFVVPASHYYATGGPDQESDLQGADSFGTGPLSIPNARPTWGPTYPVALWNTGDWIIYQIPVGGASLRRIELCLSNPDTPNAGTQVEVYAAAGSVSPPPRGDDLADAGWIRAGAITVASPGDWRSYSLNVSLPSASKYTIGIRLPNGDPGPEPGTDRNVLLAWIKLAE